MLEFTAPPPLMHAAHMPDSASGLYSEKHALLKQEIHTLLKKRAVERALPSIGFYARIFLVPKKYGKLQPVFKMKLH